jgi:hypothetical protein
MWKTNPLIKREARNGEIPDMDSIAGTGMAIFRHSPC